MGCNVKLLFWRQILCHSSQTSHVYAYLRGGFWKRRNITPQFCLPYLGANVLPFLSKKGYCWSQLWGVPKIDRMHYVVLCLARSALDASTGHFSQNLADSSVFFTGHSKEPLESCIHVLWCSRPNHEHHLQRLQSVPTKSRLLNQTRMAVPVTIRGINLMLCGPTCAKPCRQLLT